MVCYVTYLKVHWFRAGTILKIVNNLHSRHTYLLEAVTRHRQPEQCPWCNPVAVSPGLGVCSVTHTYVSWNHGKKRRLWHLRWILVTVA